MFGVELIMKKTYDYVKNGERCIVFNSETGNIVAFKAKKFFNEEKNIFNNRTKNSEVLKFFLQNNFIETDDAKAFYDKIECRTDNKILYCILQTEKSFDEVEKEFQQIIDDDCVISTAILDIKPSVSSEYSKLLYKSLSAYVGKIKIIIHNSTLLIDENWAWLKCAGELLLKYTGKEDIYSIWLNSNGWELVISLNINSENSSEAPQWIEACNELQIKYFVDFSKENNYIKSLGCKIDSYGISKVLNKIQKPSLPILLSFYKVPSNWCNGQENINIKFPVTSWLNIIQFNECIECKKNTMCSDCKFRNICNYKCRMPDDCAECLVCKQLNKLLFG